MEADYGGGIQLDPILPPVDPGSGDQTGGGLHRLGRAGQPCLVAVAADTAGAVAAHLSQGTVAVEKEHLEVRSFLGLLHHHQAVGAQGAVGGTEGTGQQRKGGGGEPLFQVVQDDKIIARAVHFPKLHGGSPFPELLCSIST